ncbi:MAG: ATP-binding cassette domain-containing protein, partial [Lachnospiraceae bacterium]|nr:ATP-binding cassette domain-containing protein [Lachnospiraceae bacterium]
LVKEITKTKVDAKQAIRDVGLENHFYKFPNQMSGGEQQRVSIVRAIAKNPALLLCDEPTGALDSVTGAMILKILKRQCDADRGNNTVIVVTHNALIADVADVVIRVKNGHIESVTENENPMNIDDVSW